MKAGRRMVNVTAERESLRWGPELPDRRRWARPHEWMHGAERFTGPWELRAADDEQVLLASVDDLLRTMMAGPT